MRHIKLQFSTVPIFVVMGSVHWPGGGWSMCDVFVMGHHLSTYSHAANTAHNRAEAYADLRGETARKVLALK